MLNKITLIFLLLTLGLLTQCAFRKAKIGKEKWEASRFDLPELIPYRKGNLWGFADSSGKIIVAPKYEKVELFKFGYAVVTLKRAYIDEPEQVNIIDKKGKELFKHPFLEIEILNKNLVRVMKPGRLFGIYSLKGKEIIAPEFTHLRNLDYNQKLRYRYFEFTKSLEPNSINNTRWLYGIMNNKGKTILAFENPYLTYLNAGVIEVKRRGSQNDEKFDYYNLKGKLIPDFKDYKLTSFHSGLAGIGKDNRWGFTDSTGVIVIPLIYEEVSYFSEEGLAAVKQKGKWGYINRKSEIVAPIQYDKIEEFKKGLAIVWKGNKQGFVGRNGEELTEIQFDRISADQAGKLYTFVNDYGFRYGLLSTENGKSKITILSEDTAKIQRNYDNDTSQIFVLWNKLNFDQQGLINTEGKLVIPLEYKRIEIPKFGMIAAIKDSLWGVINEKNEIILPFKYKVLEVIGPNLILVGKRIGPRNYLSGFINRKGEVVVPMQYSEIREIDKGVFFVIKEGRLGFIDSEGSLITPLNPLPVGYERCDYSPPGLFKVCAKELKSNNFINSKGENVTFNLRAYGYIDFYGRPYFED